MKPWSIEECEAYAKQLRDGTRANTAEHAAQAIEYLLSLVSREDYEQPVAWYVRFDNGRVDLLATPISDNRRAMWESAGKRFTVTPLYTAPPQRKPLTDEEIAKIASTPCAVVGSYVHTFARAIEAAHGIIKGEV